MAIIFLSSLLIRPRDPSTKGDLQLDLFGSDDEFSSGDEIINRYVPVTSFLPILIRFIYF